MAMVASVVLTSLHQMAPWSRKMQRKQLAAAGACRRLDTAKRNLTQTITSLRKLAMLVTTSERLQQVAERREYPEAANFLQAMGMLLEHFKR